MKKIYLPLLSLLCMASCIKNETINSVFSFTIGNVQLSGRSYAATYAHDTIAGTQNLTAYFYTTAPSSVYNAVQINYTAPGYIMPGTYNNNSIFKYSVDSTVYTETSGSLTITQIDTIAHKMSGTFQFLGFNLSGTPDNVSISNGTFNNVVYNIR